MNSFFTFDDLSLSLSLSQCFVDFISPALQAPASVALAGLCFTFATPLACAIFPQISSIAVEDLEPELQSNLRAKHPFTKVYYYNKGL